MQHVTRPLSDDEKHVLTHILSADPTEGAQVLLEQLRVARVDVHSSEYPPPHVRVRIPPGTRRLPTTQGLVCLDLGAEVLSEDGCYAGDLLVWIDPDGTLAAIEYTWAAHPADIAPPASRIRIESQKRPPSNRIWIEI